MQPYRRTEKHVDAEGVSGVQIRQNRTEIRKKYRTEKHKKTANRIKISRKFLNTANRLVLYNRNTANSKKKLPQNRTKNGAKPHHRKPLVFNRRSYMSKVMDCTPC